MKAKDKSDVEWGQWADESEEARHGYLCNTFNILKEKIKKG